MALAGLITSRSMPFSGEPRSNVNVLARILHGQWIMQAILVGICRSVPGAWGRSPQSYGLWRRIIQVSLLP